jgi:hypothetical protein
MRALSVWQPWASAIACGAKRIETRSFNTEYRGPLAIHASKRCVKRDMIELFSKYENPWLSVFPGLRTDSSRWQLLPFGAVIAIAELVDCRPTESFTERELDTHRWRVNSKGIGDGDLSWTERGLGDYAPSRFGWVLSNIQSLSRPIPYKGAQGFFHVPDRLLADAHG